MPLLDLVRQVKASRLIPDAYFQRNLVWRELHKKDFIETVLKGYPFPQMFFSRGKIDVENMSTTSCIVDGQQRTNAIIEFVDNKFAVDGRFFKNLTEDEKAVFLKYEIAVVELDLDNDSPHVLEIFKRLNRTANSLTIVEKLASEYSPTEYMYVARLLANDVDPRESPAAGDEEDWRVAPNLPVELTAWAVSKTPGHFSKLTAQLGVFTESETARKVHLMYILNIMSTLVGGFFNRNEKTSALLEDYKEFFPERDRIYDLVNSAIATIENLGFSERSFWSAKANFFSLVVAVAKRIEEGICIDAAQTAAALSNFALNPDSDYTLAAREAVNNKKERLLRHERLYALIR